ncbi:copper amine oxidase, partial [Paenibacillus darwinianus]
MRRTIRGNRNSGRKGRSNDRRPMRSVLVWVIGGTLLLQPLAAGKAWANGDKGSAAGAPTSVAAVNTAEPKLTAVFENIITSGAVRRDYVWSSVRGGAPVTSTVRVIEIDLTNPYVSLNAMNGKGGTLPSKATVASMVKETGAVAGVNADYFDTASAEATPFGAVIASGELVKSPRQLEGMFMFAVTADRVPMIDRFTVEGTVATAGGASFPLAGMNEAAYRTEPNAGYSHVNALYIYTDVWKAAERPNTASSASTPTEALVVDGVVTQIADKATLNVQPPANGYILRGHGTAAAFLREQLTVGTAVTSDLKLKSVASGTTFSPSSFQMMVGGHTILVNEGKPSSFSRNTGSLSPTSGRARTAVGYSRDNKTAYLITVEDSGSSAGMTIAELQKTMAALGVWKGINLDGGGSTTMIDRPLGEFDTKLSHPTEDGGAGTYQRPVVNAIGVYSNAPKGSLKGIKASGKGILFIGEQTEYALKAYDTYFNPLDPAGIAAQWSLDKPAVGKLSGGILTAAAPGQATLTVKSGSGSDKLPIEVIGERRIVKMSIEAGPAELKAGTIVDVPVKVALDDGSTYTIPAGSVDWELRGFTGSVQNGTIRVDGVKAGANAGYAIARYDGYSALLPFAAGSTDKPFERFESPAYGITSASAPAAVTSGVDTVGGLPGGDGSNALQLRYDFSTSVEDRTKAAYAVFNGTGVPLPDSPSGMAVDVYGDGSRNWLRAAVTDSTGKAFMVDLAQSVDWTGWKTVRADFTIHDMKYPIKLKSLYIATLKEGQDERAMSGELAFDNLMLQSAASPTPVNQAAIVLTLGKKSADVDGAAIKLDVAPLALNGVSYLPFRFVADAMGGQVGWDQTAKRVTVLRGDRLLELRLGRDDLVL